MRIIFFGEGEIADYAINILSKENEIVGIITTEKENEKTRKKNINKITKFAIDNEIPITNDVSIENMKNFIDSIDSDIFVVVSFGVIIPNSIIAKSKFPPINLHPSNLPKYRGAAPIPRCIENGETTTGISIIEVIKKMDAGDIFNKEIIDIKNLYSSELYKIAGEKGGELLCKTIKELKNKTEKRIKQDELQVTFADKIDKSELKLDFNDDVDNVINKIRAFDVFGCCYFIHNNKRVKIIKAEKFKAEKFNNTNNTVTKDEFADGYIDGCIDKKNKLINCKNGSIVLIEVQKEGKPVISGESFWNGLR